MGGLYATVPVVGGVVLLGHLAAAGIAAIEGAVILGGTGALVAALTSLGVPEDSIVTYQTDVESDGFLVMAHGTAGEMERAKTTLEPLAPRRITVHHADRLQDAPHQQLDGELPIPAAIQRAPIPAAAERTAEVGKIGGKPVVRHVGHEDRDQTFGMRHDISPFELAAALPGPGLADRQRTREQSCCPAQRLYGRHMFRSVSLDDPATTAGQRSLEPDFVVIDVETACSSVSSICQIGIVGFRNGQVMFEYETLVDPSDRFSSFNTRIHGIAAEHVMGKPCFADLHEIVDGHLGGRTTVAHSYFDKGALSAACRVHDRAMIQTTWLDSVRVAKRAWPELASHKLNVVSRRLGIPLKHHDALSDARAAGMIVVRAIEQTGVALADWMTPPVRRQVGPAPVPAADGPLKGERVAILGEPRNGPLARRIAASGGRVVSAVGTTTTILVVVAEEPFGYVRYDAQFKKADEQRRAGMGIRILSARQLSDMMAA